MTELEHLGTTYQLKLVPVFDDRMIWFEDESLCVVDSRGDLEQVTRALARWRDRESKLYLTERVRALSDLTGWHVTRISFRRQSTIWGSCSSKKHLSLNLELIKLAPDIVDYVIVHELAHTIELNHSRAFWNLVHKHCPDYPQKKSRLREYERHRLNKGKS